MAKYTVAVIADMMYTMSASFEIEAESEQEAKDLAYEKAFNEDNPDDIWDEGEHERVSTEYKAKANG